MSLERVPTGIDGLDAMIGGGFLKGNLILLAGNPGTGKTVFAAQFIYRGAHDYGEPGVYASFAEGEEILIQNISKHLGVRPKDWREDLCRVLDFATMREIGVTEAIDIILRAVKEMGAKRLVIDSFSAMAQAFKEPMDARIVLHTILYKMVRQMGCTTILTSEITRGQERIGMGIEEFVVDDVILLKDIDVRGESRDGEIYPRRLEERSVREMEMLKLRGTERGWKRCLFTLKGGFQCFGAYSENLDMTGRKAIQDIDGEHISSGIRDLDEITGGFLKGSFNLFEIEHGVERRYLELIKQVQYNATQNGRGILDIPSMGIPVPEKQRENYLSYKPETTSIEKELEVFLHKQEQLRSKTGKTPVIFIGLDTIQTRFGYEGLMRFINEAVDKKVFEGAIMFGIAKRGINRVDPLTHLPETHFVFKNLYGSLTMYGLRPKTGLYNVSSSEGGIQLTPIV